jgi:hypothetical protein
MNELLIICQKSTVFNEFQQRNLHLLGFSKKKVIM